MKMPKTDAKFKWIRLDYRLSGARRQRTFGNPGKWREAWLEANRIDALIAADEGDTGAFTVAALSQAWQLASPPRFLFRILTGFVSGYPQKNSVLKPIWLH